MKEINNKIILKYNKYYHIVNLYIFTLFSKLLFITKGIKFGSKLKVWGRTLFIRHPYSEIIIGNNCRFRSSSSSNLIGINHKCIFSTNSSGARLIIGNNCGFSGAVVGVFKQIIIGDDVLVGANCLITDSDWHLNDPRSGKPKSVKIGNNVWLGYGSIVMKGVEIGENSVIGAGSVVTKSIPANCIAAGNPCRVIKKNE